MESIKVKDLMVPVDEYITISEDDTIYEAVAGLREAAEKYEAVGCPFRAVLVCDKEGNVKGKLGQIDVLRSLEPRYSEMGDLRRVSGFGLSAEFMKSMLSKYDLWKAPLDDICRKAAGLKVGSLVSDPQEGELIEESASLNQAVHQIILGHHQSLLVTKGGKIVGILRLADVFQDVSNRIMACKV
jgi:CBS domain-containing protein